MIAAVSIVSIVVGTTVAWIAARRPRYRGVMETLGGILLISGFALLGYSLECVFGSP